MHECNAMQLLEINEKKKTKNQRTKNNGHKEKNNEVQGPCQKDSVRLSILHPNFFDAPRALEFIFTLE